MPGTRRLHGICNVKTEQVAIRNLSCFCVVGISVCENERPWKEVTLKGRIAGKMSASLIICPPMQIFKTMVHNYSIANIKYKIVSESQNNQYMMQQLPAAEYFDDVTHEGATNHDDAGHENEVPIHALDPDDVIDQWWRCSCGHIYHP